MGKEGKKRGNTLFHLTTWNSNLDFSDAIAKQLLSHSSNLATSCNQQLETPLHTAAGCANVPMVRLLLRHHPSLVTTVDAFGDTPLHKIMDPSIGAPDIGQGIFKISELLLNSAPELATAKNEDGHSPLRITRQRGNLDDQLVKLLLKYQR